MAFDRINDFYACMYRPVFAIISVFFCFFLTKFVYFNRLHFLYSQCRQIYIHAHNDVFSRRPYCGSRHTFYGGHVFPKSLMHLNSPSINSRVKLVDVLEIHQLAGTPFNMVGIRTHRETEINIYIFQFYCDGDSVKMIHVYSLKESTLVSIYQTFGSTFKTL